MPSSTDLWGIGRSGTAIQIRPKAAPVEDEIPAGVQPRGISPIPGVGNRPEPLERIRSRAQHPLINRPLVSGVVADSPRRPLREACFKVTKYS